MKRLYGLIILLLLFLFYRSCQYKEGFLNSTCADYETCVSCANKSNCVWCLSTKKCQSSTDATVCDNTVEDAVSCQVDPPMNSSGPDTTVVNADMDNNSLYHDQVGNNIFPPNAYTNGDIMYSPETVMANVSELRNEVQNLQQFVTK